MAGASSKRSDRLLGRLGRQPVHAELAQLVRGQRISRAGIAPVHVPRVLQEHRAHLLPADLLVEQRPVEVTELLAHEDRDVHPGRQPHRAVVDGLHPALGGEGVDEELLRTVGVQGAEADREHELR